MLFKKKSPPRRSEASAVSAVSAVSSRTLVLGVLGLFTLGVAALSVYVSHRILVPTFGDWAIPAVGALDALWVVMQATEIVAGNNRQRARRVRVAGLALTAVIAAIPTVDLALALARAHADFSLAVIVTPVVIVVSKGAWWIVLPSLGRSTSPQTRRKIAARRQEVADQLEVMEADAADRIELLRVASELREQVTTAETAYRVATLAAQEAMTIDLHEQAEATAQTIADMPLPALVADIQLPELEGWEPTAPALSVTPALPTVAQVSPMTGAEPTPERVSLVTLPELAAVMGVAPPQPNTALTDDQLALLLRYLRYRTDPVTSYRQAAAAMRAERFKAGEERVRHMWRVMVEQEAASGRPVDDGSDTQEMGEDADASA